MVAKGLETIGDGVASTTSLARTTSLEASSVATSRLATDTLEMVTSGVETIADRTQAVVSGMLPPQDTGPAPQQASTPWGDDEDAEVRVIYKPEYSNHFNMMSLQGHDEL